MGRPLPIFITILLLANTALLRAGEVEWQSDGPTEESFIPRYAVASSYFSWTSDADFSAAGGSLSQVEAGVQGNFPILMEDRFRLTAGIQYRWNRLRFTNAPTPFGTQDLDLHRVDVPFNLWADLSHRWRLWVRLQPGWYSDFGHINADDFILTSLALLSYRLNDTTKVAFGGFYSRDLGEARLLPAVGLIVEPNRHWSFALTFPRAEVAYAPNEDWLFAGRALLNGAGWNIADPSGAPGDVDLEYKSIRVGLGIERRLSGPWWAYLDAGAQLGQELTIEDAPYRFSQDLDSSVYATAGVRLRVGGQ
ncbi:MAG: DUF6268 family outer membrane beta-barrel protein [Verrucomicrobiota bacterium]